VTKPRRVQQSRHVARAREKKNAYQDFDGERNHFKDLEVGGRIILKHTLK